MYNENTPDTEENWIPEALYASRNFGRILHQNSVEVGAIATASNHAAVVRNLLEKIHLLSEQCDHNRRIYQESANQCAQITAKYEDLRRLYNDELSDNVHQMNVLKQWESQMERQATEVSDLRNTMTYLQESWNTVNRNYRLREWRVQELSRQLQQFIPEFVAPSLLDDEREGPTISDVYLNLSDNESMDPYQNARTPSLPRSDTSAEYVPPRKIFKEEEA